MEYNMRTMLRVDNIGPRMANSSSSPLEPCTNLSEEYREACYYWQPQWWLSTLEDESSASFEVLGGYCTELDGQLRRKCFEGVGNIIPQSAGYDPASSILFCQAAARDARDELFCRADAANSFHAITFARERAPRMCEGLEGNDRTYCLKHSYNEFNQTNAPRELNGP
jgi:hypothetical protein